MLETEIGVHLGIGGVYFARTVDPGRSRRFHKIVVVVVSMESHVAVDSKRTSGKMVFGKGGGAIRPGSVTDRDQCLALVPVRPARLP